MNEELLISLVQGYKELYDLRDPRYDDQQRRDNIWKEIGEIMHESGTTCRDRWRRIRDNYRRARKLRNTKSGQAATSMRKPKFEDLLSFLTPYISNEDETFSNFPSYNISQESSCENNSVLENSQDSSSSNASQSIIKRPSSSQENTTPYKRNCRKANTQPQQLSQTHLLLQEYIEKKYGAPKSKCHKIVDFFKNLGETVSTFPQEVQIRVKREVFKIVTDAEELVFKNYCKPQYNIIEVPEESAPSVFDASSSKHQQPPNQIITNASENVNPNDSDTQVHNISTQDSNNIDIHDTAIDAFINSIQKNQT